MRRRLCAVVAGLVVLGAGTVAGTAAADGTGPVASPPSAPQTQTVSGVAANGVQLSLTAPAKLPLDLAEQQLAEREADVTVKDVGGQGYSGAVTMTLTSEGPGVSSVSLRLDHVDTATGLWETEPIPAGESSFTVTDTASVPANGTQILKLRLSPGTTVVDDVKLSVSANGASAVVTMPVTGPTFQASGLTAGAHAGSPAVVTGKLTNPTDVDLDHVPVKLVLCPTGTAGCLAHPSDVKVEVLTDGAWHPVVVTDGTATNGMTAMVLPDVSLPAGGSKQFSVRVTVGAGAFGMAGQPTPSGSGQPSGTSAATGPPATPTSAQPPAQPLAVPLALGPVGLTLVGQPAMTGTLTVQPPPQPTPTTPSSTPSPTTSSSTPSPTPTTSESTDSATPTATGTTPTPVAVSSTAAASTPGASSSSSPTILVAIGLLAVCLALVLWWTLMKRRERMAREGLESAHEDDHDEHGHHEQLEAEHHGDPVAGPDGGHGAGGQQ